MMIKNFRNPIKKLVRHYATSSDSVNYHEKYGLHPWPKGKDPNPNEVFDITDSELGLPINDLNKILKDKYVKYIKIYHPDVSKNIVIHDHNDNILTNEMKRIRFDQIKNSYDILRDPKRRISYRNFRQTSWNNYKPETSNFNAYRMANAHRKKYDFKHDEQFWQAGTWEDYYHMRFKRDPPTQEELDKNKYKILACVVLVCVLSGVLQTMLAVDRTNERLRQVNLSNLKSLKDLKASQENYGEGLSSLERLRRFLLFRRSGQNLPEGVSVDEIRDEEKELLTKYARKKVEKFST